MKRALVSVYTFLIGIFLTSTTHGFDVITISGDNPQMDIRGKVNGQEEFKYTSYGTRQLGVGARIEEHWLSLTLADPRDSDAQRTNRALIEYRHFSEIQWGLSLSHFKNFELNDGSNRRSEKFGLSLINSHIYDFAIGYSSDNLSVIFKTSTMSDSLQTSKVDFQNLSQSMGLILTYRF